MAKPKASWESYLGNFFANIQYGNDGETTPQYWNVNFTLGTFGEPLQSLRRTHHEHELLRLTFKAAIVTVDPSITYVGFLAAYIGYGASAGGPAIDLGAGSIPIIGSGVPVSPIVDSVDYDPVSLPVGGVNFPIWQRKSIDLLTVDHYLDPNENPTSLIGCGLVQVQGSTAINPAATIKMWYRYERIEEK